MDDNRSRSELILGTGTILAVQTVFAAVALLAVLFRFWTGVVAVLVWISVLLVGVPLLDKMAERHDFVALVLAAWRRLNVAFALVTGYAIGTLGLTALIGTVHNVIRGDVLARPLLFDVSLVVYMIIAFVPGLLLLLAIPAWLVKWVSSWALRFALGLLGFLAAAAMAVVIIFGPIYFVTEVLGGRGPPDPSRAELSSSLLFWALYALTIVVAIAISFALSKWEGLQLPGRGGR